MRIRYTGIFDIGCLKLHASNTADYPQTIPDFLDFLYQTGFSFLILVIYMMKLLYNDGDLLQYNLFIDECKEKK
jgi:hypothetical protein